MLSSRRYPIVPYCEQQIKLKSAGRDIITLAAPELTTNVHSCTQSNVFINIHDVHSLTDAQSNQGPPHTHDQSHDIHVKANNVQHMQPQSRKKCLSNLKENLKM